MNFRYQSFLFLGLCLTAPLLAQTSTLYFTASSIPVGKGPRSAILIDLNRDGHRDLAVANIKGSTISLLFGGGTGTFELRDSIATLHKAPHDIISGDFNGDGILDAVTANRDSNTVGLFLGDGKGSFSTPSFFNTGSGPRWMAVADFNEDGHSDLAVTNRDDDNVTIFHGDGTGHLNLIQTVSSGDGPVPIAAGDLNGDGIVDLAVGNDLADTLVILSGDSTGHFTLTKKFSTGQGPKNISIGDLNQDGLADMAVACLVDGSVTLLFADTLGNYTHTSYPAGGGSFAVVFEDFDGDGKQDFAVADGVKDNVAIFLNIGQGMFADPQTFSTGLAPHALVTGDFNNDGRPDLALPNTGDNTVTILINETPAQASVHIVSVLQKVYTNYHPDPIISRVGQPLRMLITTNSREHVNRLRIRPFIEATDVVRVGQILTVEFTPQDTGRFQIENIGHGFKGDILILEDSIAVRNYIRNANQQSIALIHSNTQTQIYPSPAHVLEGIPLTIYNISLDDTHWVSIEPWVKAPATTEPGNVIPGPGINVITAFNFTPGQAGTFEIKHTVHGFTGSLIIEDGATVGVDEYDLITPQDFILDQNYPNPFNASTSISFRLQRAMLINLSVYDISGRRVEILLDEYRSAGPHVIRWQPRIVGSGIYLFRLEGGQIIKFKKAVLLK